MVLLTSGQVSFAISSFIVFLFTSALFLSGYVLQQQTVRNLRHAIKPKEAPNQQARLYLPPQFALQAKPSPKENGREDVVVEVKESDGESVDNEKASENEDTVIVKTGELRRKLKHEVEQTPSNAPERERPKHGSKSYDLPLTKDEETATGNEPNEKSQKSGIETRAERRKRLKAELMAGSEEEGFKGYRRRMW